MGSGRSLPGDLRGPLDRCFHVRLAQPVRPEAGHAAADGHAQQQFDILADHVLMDAGIGEARQTRGAGDEDRLRLVRR